MSHRLSSVAMRVVSGRIVDGRVELEGEAPAEGTVVAVLAREDDETFELSPSNERELLAAIAEAEGGNLVDGDELLLSLRP